ncbi:glyoxalase/bleomycin resistance/extradiol dioxygenase family protein [Bacillus hwajinpoensis]|uniref:Glyoxalase/bleomycin resistance/extradiol dioxygenase family protein n=1 Tax=Guptibacillus hwajinpoensis TaxID=208199 RepID=A0A845F2Y1_9BACL|nr:VOC family protein [Pseudalkalibacillus hwajinpoensis]MYL65151.1 glyoxalase/bleomycin resistance/extradiol dioxygenase family protein [Pseudalkalibacillus hwajinpoensis]
MARTAKQVFVNLPVKNLDKSIHFFTELGFEFNPQFTDENATCMVINENTFVMLLVEEFFKTFTTKELVNPKLSTEVIMAISAESNDEVDEIVNRALNAGGSSSNDAIDHGFMYAWSFQDLDGHLWEVMHMQEGSVE